MYLMILCVRTCTYTCIGGVRWNMGVGGAERPQLACNVLDMHDRVVYNEICRGKSV